jgi:hypothetical protein
MTNAAAHQSAIPGQPVGSNRIVNTASKFDSSEAVDA